MAAEKSFTKRIAQASDLDVAANDRLADSKALFAANRPAMAIATAIYSIEIRLKVLICKKLELPALPKAFEIHDLEALLVLSGLSSRLNEPNAASVKSNWDNILTLEVRLNDLRYTPDHNWSPHQASTFLRWLEAPSDGVLPWLLNQK